MNLQVVRIDYSRFRGEGLLTQRDIRALVLKFIPENNEYYRLLNWHERSVPRIVYAKPGNSYTLIYSTIPDVAEYVANKIHKTLVYVNGKKVAIKGARVKKVKFVVEELNDSVYMYKTRTNIITAVNDTEWKINTAVKHRGGIENLENDVLANILKRTITHIYDEWFGFEPDVENLRVRIVSGKHFLDHTYKEGEKFPSWGGYFFCNYALPPFVGYKIGLGMGEVLLKAELPKERISKVEEIIFARRLTDEVV